MSKRTVLAQELVDSLLQSNDPQLVQEVHTLLGRHLGTAKVEVFYAGDLSSQDQHDIKDHIKKQFPDAAEVTFIADESLIGGIKIVYKDFLYEDTIKSRLQRLENSL